jgi:outer membrane protein assembly factor BamB
MWWFSENSKRLGYKDNRKIKLGITHKVKGKPVLCKHGLHASKKIIDALEYARGDIIWKVELGGVVLKGDDKMVATERTYIDGGVDISEVLKKFARMCALDVVHLWDAPDVVMEYLKTGNETLRYTAWSAACNSAGAGGAAWAGAGGAARYASRHASMGAARDTAAEAAEAACDASWEAVAKEARLLARVYARKKQNVRLTRMVNRAIKKGGA